jgi:hypothetical protein
MGNIIRFFSTTKPDQSMDILTIEDLRAEGFRNYRYHNHDHISTRGKYEVIDSQKYMVHNSVPVDSSHQANQDVPYIEWVPGAGFEAKWGAVRYQLRNEMQLWQFMRFFEYPISIDQPQANEDSK